MTEISKDEELYELLATTFSEAHVNDLLNEFEALESKGILQIVNDSPEKDSLKNKNQLRFGYGFYISLKQLKNNIKDNFVLIGLSILFSKTKLTTAIIQLVARILPCCHLIKSNYRCVFFRAVELFHQDGLYHGIDDFYIIKESSENCNNLTIECSYRKNQSCGISNKDILDSLNCLVEMNIIERNVRNEYRYNKW